MNLASPFAFAIYAIVFLTLLGLPIGHSMIAGSILYLCLAGLDLGTAAEQLLNGMYASHVLLAVPLFILAGGIMNASSIARRLINLATALLGFVRGGLAMVTVGSSMFFAEISGSAVADVAALGSLLIPAMKSRGYSKEFAAAVTSSSASLAIIIPPSIPMILYAAMAQESAVKIFVAGITDSLFARAGQHYLRGHFEKNGNQLYVSRGLGFGKGSNLPRMNSDPEVALVTLRRQETQRRAVAA